MRPGIGSDVTSLRSRKSSIVDNHTVAPTSHAPTSFFIAREEDILIPSSTIPTSHKDREARNLDSVYGVQSLDEALGDVFLGKSALKDDGEEDTPSRLAGIQRRKRSKAPVVEVSDKFTLDSNTTTKNRSAGSTQESSPRQGYSTQQAAQQSPQTATVSQPLTPLQLESPFPNSALPSTPRSFRSLRLSDEEEESNADGGSQAVVSSGEEEDEATSEEARVGMGGEAPELVMPSLSMPSRRPFTARGKQMGRLKICVAGANGVGKTSLIKGIVQQCEDIVHVDPLNTSPPTLSTSQNSRSRTRGKNVERTSTVQIMQIHASTRAYPAWWSEMEESRVLRRRKSFGDTVLERNISFIDTPGFEKRGAADQVVHYLEGLMHRNASVSALNDSELLSVLSGSGGVQVDVVIFVFGPDWNTDHIEYCQRLSKLTNLIPVIGKADAMSPEAYSARKKALLRDLDSYGIQPFLFGKSSVGSPKKEEEPSQTTFSTTSTLRRPITSSPPFAISCLAGSDEQEMDASLLMSPSYNPPFISSDLQDLVSTLFEPENIAWLRHTAVRKFLQWRGRQTADVLTSGDAATGHDPMLLPTGGLGIRDHIAAARAQQQQQKSRNTTLSLLSIPNSSAVLVSRHSNVDNSSPSHHYSSALGIGLSDYTRSMLRDHVASEERLAQVQLAKWASDLQRGLRTERRAFEELAQRERASWLLERIGEEVRDGHIGLVSQNNPRLPEWAVAHTASDNKSRDRKGKDMELPTWAKRRGEHAMDMYRDPLGLCGFGDSVSKGLSVVVRLLGGGVLVGTLCVAVARAWGFEPDRAVWTWWGTSAYSP